MRGRSFACLLAVLLIWSSLLPAAHAGTDAQTRQGVYLGVYDFAHSDGYHKDMFRYRFQIDGVEQVCSIRKVGAYEIQNLLQEGGVYGITIQSGQIVAAAPAQPVAEGEVAAVRDGILQVSGQSFPLAGAVICRISVQAGGAAAQPIGAEALTAGSTVRVYRDDSRLLVCRTFLPAPYTPPVRATPGVRTISNFLATALQPVGTTLYIYGGAWNWQDTGASVQATTLGLPSSWVVFFQSQTDSFTYRNNADPGKSYYWRHYNEYYYAGADCSGYVGWAVYNFLHTQSGQPGYVCSADEIAKNLHDRGLGSWTRVIRGPQDFRPGDIFSMDGHVWICLGVCGDGSMVILHSTPSPSYAGQPGGGVQLSGVGWSADCQAAALAREYMQRYYPQWSARYPTVWKSYVSYTSFTCETAGKFSWGVGTADTLTDPDGFLQLSAAEILQKLFDSSADPETDVCATDYDAVCAATARGVMTGVFPNPLAVPHAMVRTMAAQVLYQMAELPVSDPA